MQQAGLADAHVPDNDVLEYIVVVVRALRHRGDCKRASTRVKENNNNMSKDAVVVLSSLLLRISIRLSILRIDSSILMCNNINKSSFLRTSKQIKASRQNVFAWPTTLIAFHVSKQNNSDGIGGRKFPHFDKCNWQWINKYTRTVVVGVGRSGDEA